MSFTEYEYTVPQRAPMDVYQAYDRMLDIEMKNLWSPQCWVRRITLDGDKILITSNVAWINATSTGQDMVFQCKMRAMWSFSSYACFFFGIFIAVIIGGMGIAGGVLPAFVFALLLGVFLIWGGFHNRDACIKRTKQIIDVICSYL